MGVDFDAYLVYGFQLDNDKLSEFLDKLGNDACFDFYEWIEDIEDRTNCSIMWTNHYDFPLESDMYFGIRIYNKATAEVLEEIIKVRTQEICDDFIEIFGSYDIIYGEPVPELFAVPVIH